MILLIKNTFIKIKKSLGRFLSILFIIALGISVFIGLRESSFGMLFTADNYYDEYQLMDFKITSTYGLNDDDIVAIKNLFNVSKVVPTYSIDVLDNGKAIRLHAIEDEINNVVLKDGRMPEDNDECLADSHEYEVGDTITFSKTNLEDYISIKKCEVVGTIDSPMYIRDEKGISSVGNGKLTSFVYLSKEVFTMNYYTEVYIIAKNTSSENSYYDDYETELNKLRTQLEELKPIRETIRYEEVLKEANQKISDAEKELYGNLAESEANLAEVKTNLDENSADLNKVKSSLETSLVDLESTVTSKEAEFNNTLESYNLTLETLPAKITEFNEEKTSLEELLQTYSEGTSEYSETEAELNNLNTKLGNLNTIYNSYTSFTSEIESQRSSLEENLTKINSSLDEIESNYSFYYDGLDSLETEKANALAEINEAKEELNNIEKPVWYLLDRTDNNGYISYKEDVIKVSAISKTLPIFFVIVSMLVCLNSLSRLIEEERTEMGILQAIGYSKAKIALGYMIYVFIAALLGIAIGLTIGYSIIPKIIYGIFLSRYYVPKLITVINPLPFSLVIVVTLLLMALVVIIACYKELKEVPARLLRPKAPKSGKKVFLEQMTKLWQKLNFTWKVTIRNLFRYKKRIIMTVLGVAGCTALLLTGFGLNDSINNISKLQYGKIIHYDAMFILNENQTELGDKITTLFNDNNILNPSLINEQAYKFSFKNKTEDAYVVVPSNNEELEEYISLYNLDNKEITIPSYGALITEQMADLLGVKAGDTIEIRDSDNALYIIYVSDIVENYTSHYIYMDKSYYEETFNKTIDYNMIIAKLNEKPSTEVALTDYNILSVNYTEDILDSFDSFVQGLNKIIYLILICAGALALIVLYNLTIVNISERKREVATLKVLGFNDKEISAYIYRETIILTIFGVIIGLVLGIFLHKFIIYTAQTDNILFIKTIKWYSYIFSAAITILFSFLVQLIISKTLKNIDMIESLKSVE
ncbi:MAG TPA: FtsX-like permease family protein [Bacilli bacterium]|nr:FtsX-like permease family protein [Bacilli bacterium]